MNTALIDAVSVKEGPEMNVALDEIRELAESQLALVGGGGGEVIFG
jgi:hypothetical protein